jgi:competence protein ComEA
VLVALISVAIVLYFAVQQADRSNSPNHAIQDVANDPEATIVVAIDGAVGTPGVYSLPGDARVQNAIEAAGGVTTHADLAAVNPAARVHDGDRVIIPFVSTPVPTRDPNAPAAAEATQPVAASDPLNINTATADELDELPGIGEVIANRIVAYRESHGAFATVDDLAEVSGISERMVDDLRPLVTTGP